MTDTQTEIPPLQKWKIKTDINSIDLKLRDAYGTYGQRRAVLSPDIEHYIDELLDKRLELMRMI